ncbi:uncharacterized protein LOC143424534 [Xylocopa sonorina]|uniref:uncharacterized protein LOC143424534 n=1 Tax=Xylocopa sonorina TaxID=1818115 RepID=UPI00403AB166
MACGISFEATATSTVLFLLVLLQAALVWDEVHGAPAKRNDILAGTEFLSVFINGAMATPPQRRRGFRRGGQAASVGDSATAESHQHEASIYRISRNPGNRQVVSRARNSSGREEVVRFYPISQKTLENRQQNLASLIDELSTSSDISSTRLAPQASSNATTVASTPREKSLSRSNATSNSTNQGFSRQKVIGVSVTSTVEATPYKVRVEHYDNTDETVVTRPPSFLGISPKDISKDSRNATTRFPTTKTTSPSTTARTTTTTTKTTTTTIIPKSSTTMTPPSSFVTEELTNIVSESNRSEFSVDEGLPSTSWRGQSSITPGPVAKQSTTHAGHREESNSSARNVSRDMITLPTEENYELPEENAEPKEYSEEPVEVHTERFQPQGRKAGRHYDASNYNRPGTKAYSQPSKSYKPPRQYSEPAKLYSEPSRVYSESEKVYGEPAKVYSEPAKVYSEPAKVYSEPARVYSEPAKVYGEPEKVYSETSKVYSEPAKIYSEPAKVYSEPSKLYDAQGQPLGRERNGEPDEQNFEVDESVSVSSNGNAHGPQMILTEPSNASEVEDGHKVGYVVEGRNYRKYRVEERTPDGFIVGEYGVVSHDDGSLRGVRYTADGTINPRLIYDALMKFLSL